MYALKKQYVIDYTEKISKDSKCENDGGTDGCNCSVDQRELPQ